jgi:transcriptional regulator with XRE-family HTH domain
VPARDGPAPPSAAVLGSYLRAQRKLADLSLRQLAEMAQVSNAYLSQIERGLHQPSVKVLRSIADALKLPGASVLVEAGLIDASPAPTGDAASTGTEAAILADRELTEQDKTVLVELYRNLRQRHTRPA